MDRERTVLRPRLGPGIAIAVWVLGVVNLIAFGVLHEWESLVRAVPVVAFVAVAVWVLFGVPAVIVERTAVTVVNPARSIRIPFTKMVDIEPSFSLVLRTTQGRYRAWAAPGGGQPSNEAELLSNEQVASHLALPDDGSFEMSALALPGLTNMSNAAIAALAIRRGMQAASTSVNGVVPVADDSPVSVRWHLVWLGVLVVLLVASVVALVA
ncbi:hypothetical protein [Humibacter ginsenosidimutans]|uniref:PH domain-containing protein n=1 Tax=Humibacter ginsenosidimutans TaxID=2599293 RepID=A0A5B8M5S1_9MICO|nr:hypothetical protein [Humibacter ginsenosidimutans]QDZ15294.1 hypothetical protein FPZ11_11450 [Humibacter ginsenosidimutans]